MENRITGELSVTLKGYGFVELPGKNEDIFIAKDNLHGAVDGDIVEIRYMKKKHNKQPDAEVVRVIRHNTEPATIEAIMKKYKLLPAFPAEVLQEAEKVSRKKISDCMFNRVDLRGLPIITIDPADARDLDDAVSLVNNADGTITLGVHIADVSEYVTADSALDKEAYRRGTSVYFPDRVLPMLPTQLSNGVCSLNPNEPRLTLSVLMTLDKKYNLLSYQIKKSLIQSVTRFSYDEVQAILDDKADHQHKAMLLQMAEITKKLEHDRQARGEITFNVPEPKIVLDEKGQIAAVYSQPHNLSHRIIETFMVLTNEVVAEHCYKLHLPFVYRIHEKPDSLKVIRFLSALTPFQVQHHIDFENPTGFQYQEMLDNIKDENVKIVVSSLALRSMQKAKYDPHCVGHYALGSTYYCHFTSPIRRYPDLTIHRIIKMHLDNQLNAQQLARMKAFVVAASQQSSQTELDAVAAEREVDDLKCAEYMQAHIGETFDGVVNGITDFGVFVYLPANTAEGLVRIENLPADHYLYHDGTMQMIGKKSKIRMGDPMKVKVIGVNLHKSKIEFTANF
ncbi:MAG: ribonuclease R [Eubacteriales bacterium]|nr:ribonuclease R [Eubacteriales bacterium]